MHNATAVAGYHHNMLCGLRKEPSLQDKLLRRILQADGPQPCGLLIPPVPLLHIEEEMHPALEQASEFLPSSRTDRLDPSATLADQDCFLTWSRDIHGRFDPHRAIV